MAYLRIKRGTRASYYYILESTRRGGKVSSKVLQYLGTDPDPATLKRALVYWKVGTKREPKRGKR
jgi:hypothetical protein